MQVLKNRLKQTGEEEEKSNLGKWEGNESEGLKNKEEEEEEERQSNKIRGSMREE